MTRAPRIPRAPSPGRAGRSRPRALHLQARRDARRDARREHARRREDPDRDHRRPHAGEPLLRLVLRPSRQVRAPDRHRVRARGRDEPRAGRTSRTARVTRISTRKMLCFTDTNHEWDGSRTRIQRRQDGWLLPDQPRLRRDRAQPQVSAAAKNGERALWWYDERDIPFYYDLASTFGIGDHYHSSAARPDLSEPRFPLRRDELRRDVQHAPPTSARPRSRQEHAHLRRALEKRGSHVDASTSTAFPHIPRVGATVGAAFGTRWGRATSTTRTSRRLLQRRRRDGTLPQVVFVDGNITRGRSTATTSTRPADIQVGQQFVSERHQHALGEPAVEAASPSSSPTTSTAASTTTSRRPAACPPDDIAPDPRERRGRRVPRRLRSARLPRPVRRRLALRQARVTSRTRRTTTRASRASSRRSSSSRRSPTRDANADPLFDFFDFEHPPFLTPPVLERPSVDANELAYCKKTFTRPPPSNFQRGPHGR